jgi:hypothetical protein
MVVRSLLRAGLVEWNQIAPSGCFSDLLDRKTPELRALPTEYSTSAVSASLILRNYLSTERSKDAAIFDSFNVAFL